MHIHYVDDVVKPAALNRKIVSAHVDKDISSGKKISFATLAISVAATFASAVLFATKIIERDIALPLIAIFGVISIVSGIFSLQRMFETQKNDNLKTKIAKENTDVLLALGEDKKKQLNVIEKNNEKIQNDIQKIWPTIANNNDDKTRKEKIGQKLNIAPVNSLETIKQQQKKVGD